MVDTPGILAGSKQTEGREYKYAEAVEWFASRADRILLMFDAHKLDIGDEFNQVLVLLRAHSDKLRVVSLFFGRVLPCRVCCSQRCCCYACGGVTIASWARALHFDSLLLYFVARF